MTKKIVRGVVASNKMDKTVVVLVQNTMRHPRYEKVVKVKKKYYAHTDKPLNMGDQVSIIECRPLSKMKRWRVCS
jgi:small subunit ribosomal protein S17